jgi:hypothetical protein
MGEFVDVKSSIDGSLGESGSLLFLDHYH